MDQKRRMVLKGSMAAGTVGIAAAAGLIMPRTVMAAWSEAAFKATSIDAALGNLGVAASPADSGSIKIQAPDIAENGAVVPVKVSTDMGNLEKITLFVEANNTPLACSFEMNPALEGFVSTRVKMSKTSNIVAVVQAGGKSFRAAKEVKVTIGGCGG